MSHFAKVKLKASLELVRSTLNAMGLSYTEHPQGKQMAFNPAWGEQIHIAHLIIDRESLRSRSGGDYYPSMDVGFVKNEDNTYSPVLDEYVLRGHNQNFGQQFALKYTELAAEQQGYTVVRDSAGNPVFREGKNGERTLSIQPAKRAVVRR
jgi:hypothetical protein